MCSRSLIWIPRQTLATANILRAYLLRVYGDHEIIIFFECCKLSLQTTFWKSSLWFIHFFCKLSFRTDFLPIVGLDIFLKFCKLSIQTNYLQIVVPYIILGNYHFAKHFSCISLDVSFANCGLQFSVLDRYCANRCSGQLFLQLVVPDRWSGLSRWSGSSRLSRWSGWSGWSR